MPRAITARHDAIVQVLAGMFRRVGDVRVEVKCAGETRLRPDLEIILPDRALLVDVAMVHPASLGRRVTTPLAAARDIENAKMAKYRSVAQQRGANFLAFIMESYGALGKQACEVLRLLTRLLIVLLTAPTSSRNEPSPRLSLWRCSAATPSYRIVEV